MSVTMLEITECPDLDAALDRPVWMDQGICRALTDLFFAPHAERPPARLRREAAARQVCMRCPVPSIVVTMPVETWSTACGVARARANGPTPAIRCRRRSGAASPRRSDAGPATRCP